MKRKLMRKIALMTCAALALTLLAACTGPPATVSPPPSNKNGQKGGISPQPAVASDYSEIFKAISGTRSRDTGLYRNGFSMFTIMEDAVPMEAESAGEPNSAPAMDDFSGTNVQVEGVDEADVVKTDGEYIYMLRDSEIIILKADGENTKVISRQAVGSVSDSGRGFNPTELYVSGDRMAILGGSAGALRTFVDEPVADIWPSQWVEHTSIEIFDISNRSAPKKICILGQDGGYTSSRLLDGVVYVISSYYVGSEISEDKPGTFVPGLYRDGARENVSPDCVVVLPEIEVSAYTVITSYDVETGDVIGNRSELGGSGTVYMNSQNLYVAGSRYDGGESDAYKDGNYTVTEYKSREYTVITRYSLDAGNLGFEASGEIDGILLNQFSMDEKDGYLRVVATVYEENYRIYVDEEKGFTNYDWGDSRNNNALYILDSSLNLAGSIEELAENERVYSVRFDGDYGYFVTFRQVDPLFTVDLSDPSNPSVLSALKIPGFSDYLHVYGEGRLFGLGMNADEVTGRTEGMKLSMFDTSDPGDVFEKHKLSLDAGYSEARYNHKSILIAPARDIIAFPTNQGYEVYGYSDESGFYKRASIDLASDGYWNQYGARGLYIGGYAYICDTNWVSVMDMESFMGVTRIALD